jgi:hypothetical protein
MHRHSKRYTAQGRPFEQRQGAIAVAFRSSNSAKERYLTLPDKDTGRAKSPALIEARRKASTKFAAGGLGVSTGVTLAAFFAGNPLIVTIGIPWHYIPEMIATFFYGMLCRRLQLTGAEFAGLLTSGGILTVVGVLAYLRLLMLPAIAIETVFVILLASGAILGWEARPRGTPVSPRAP